MARLPTMVAAAALVLLLAVGAFAQDCDCDVMLVLDASGSILPVDWPNVGNFAKIIVNDLQSGGKLGVNGSRVGIVTFGNTATLVQPLTNDATTLLNAITNLQKTTGTTNTAAAITVATQELVSKSQGPDSCQTIKVVTDGMSNEPYLTQVAAKAAKAANITLIAVGVGPMANVTELQLMASAPTTKNAVELDDFKSLAQFAHALFDRCSNPSPPALNSTQSCSCDVMIVLDSSGSIPATQWERVRDFARVYANAYKSRLNNKIIRMGLVTYSTNATLNVGLTYDYNALLAGINNAVRLGGTTNTAAALTLAGNELLSNQQQNLTCQTIKIVTDGISNNPSQTAQVAYEIKTVKQIQILAVGIGNAVSKVEMANLASEPLADNTYYINDFSNLTQAAHKLADKCDDSLNTTTITPQTPDVCHCDLYLLLDSSGSISTTEWASMQKFAYNMVGNLYNYLGPDDVRVTIIVYGTTANTVVRQSSNYNELIGAIQSMKQIGGATNTYLALDMTRQLIETDTGNINKCKLVKVVTDGTSSSPSLSAASAHMLKKLDLADVMAVAVGPGANNAEIPLIVSPPASQNIINVTSFTALEQLPSKLVGQCNHSVTPSPLLPKLTPTPVPVDDCVCDMMIVLDSSGSIPKSAWISMLDFTRVIINDLAPVMGPTGARLGIVRYSSTATLVSGLTWDSSALLNVVAKMALSTTSGGTRTDLGLSAATDELIRSPRSAPKKCKTIKLVTDGASTVPSATISAAHTAKVYGINIFAIGVGNGINKNELNAVATDPDSKNVVMIAAFTGLDQWAHAIGDKCNKAGTATPLPLPFATDPCHCDYALVVDTSLSIGNNYPIVKQFLTQFVNNLQTYLDGDNDTRVSIVGFASTAYVATPLTGTFATLIAGIGKLPQLASGTNTASGILAGQGQLVANSRGLGACKRMIVVTDGASTPAVTGPAKATAQAHIAKSQYQIQVSVVGVGVPASAAAELSSIASAPLTTNSMTISNFASLPNVASTMVGQCAQNATPNAFQQDCQCDIMLVFDGSGSVPATAWQQTEDFCVQLITGWSGAMQAGKSRIGIVTFGTTPKMVSPLTNDVTSLVNLCSTMSQNGGGTNTADALTMAGNELMNKGGLCRGIKLLTDGNSNNPKATDLVAEKMKLQGRIVIMAIGIGKGINMNELRDVATAPTTTNAINIADFTGLGTVASSITGKCSSAVYNQQTQCQYTNMMKCTLTTSKDRCALPVAYNSCAATYQCQDVLKYLCATQFMTNTMYKTCPTVPSMCAAANTASGCDTSAFQTCQNNANKYASTTCARLNRYVACAFATACQDMSQAYCQGSNQGCTLTGCQYLTPIIASPPPVLSPPKVIPTPLVSTLMPVASPMVIRAAAEQAAIDESLSMFLPAGTKWNASARSSGSSVAILGGLAVLIAALAGALVALVIKYRRSAASADEEELEEHLVA